MINPNHGIRKGGDKFQHIMTQAITQTGKEGRSFQVNITGNIFHGSYGFQ